jgi:nicotinamide-nucleotide amidase
LAGIPTLAQLHKLARALGERLAERGEWLATAESCTGGLIAKLLTDIPGSSDWFERGLVTYSNRAKQELLGVPADTLSRAGAVSAETALAMAKGLAAAAPVHWALSVTGIAGPGGGSPGKPVGTVWLAWAGTHLAPFASRYQFGGGRDAVRQRAAAAVLETLLQLLEDSGDPGA